ncbi:uncharacterized protein LOC140704410 [Pogona vitticeps]
MAVASWGSSGLYTVPHAVQYLHETAGEVVRRFGLRSQQYADDTQLYLSFSTNPGVAVTVLNSCLNSIMVWMRVNKLRLNPDKFEVLLVGAPPDRLKGHLPTLDGITLPLKDRVRSLGVLLDPSLTLEAQVDSVSRGAFLQLRRIYQLRPYLDEQNLAAVTHALVTTRLDYCNALYVGLPLKTVRRLQLAQNRAARLVSGAAARTHITPVLKNLHWLPVAARAQFKVLTLTYKALNGLGPGYLKDRLLPYVPARPLRSGQEALLKVPSLKEVKGMACRNRAFSVVAPQLWNTLPREIRLAPTLLAFRRQAKTFLFTQHFN